VSAGPAGRPAIHYVDIRKPKRGMAYSLRIHLAMGFGMSAILLSALMSFAIGELASERTSQIIGGNFAMLAEELRDKLDYGLQERVRDIVALASIDARIPTVDLQAARRARIQELQRIEPNFAWLGYADASGNVKTATRNQFEGANVAGTEWFREGLKSAAVGEVHDARFLSPPPGESRARVLDIAAPVKDAAGRVTGVLGAHLDWMWAQQMRQTLLDMPAERGKVEVLVLSIHGALLLGGESGGDVYLPKGKLDKVGLEGRWAMEEWPDGKNYVSSVVRTRGYAQKPDAGWYVMVRQELDAALAPVRDLQFRIVMAGAVAGLFFAGLSWWFAGQVAQPLRIIADSAERLGEKDGVDDIAAAEGYLEIEMLSISLRRMVSRLRRHEEELRQARDKLDLRVRERSALATRAQAELQNMVVEREHAQRSLERALERLELALEVAGMAVWSYDISSGRVDISSEWTRILGGAPAPTVTTIEALILCVPHAERENVMRAFDEAVRGGEGGHYVIRHHVTANDGRLVYTESRGRIVDWDASGRAVRMIGAISVVSP
jgi:PAS domain-containing protein